MKQFLRGVIDIEASGLGPFSYPIEIAIVDLDTDFQWSTLIRPEGSWEDGEWDELAEEMVHDISLDKLRAEGMPASLVADHLWKLVMAATIYSDAIEMDSFWLSRLAECSPAPLEQIRLTPAPLPDDGEAFDRAHRALADAVQLKRRLIALPE